MILVMLMVVRIFTMSFFQLFKLEVTHGGLQCLSGDAMLVSRLQRPSPRNTEAPRRIGRPVLGMLPSQKRPVEDEAGRFFVLLGKEQLLQGKEQAEPSQPGKNPKWDVGKLGPARLSRIIDRVAR